MSEQNESLDPQLQEWLSIRDEHIQQLQEELTHNRASLRAAQQNARDVQAIRQEHISYVNAYQQKTVKLEQEVHQWQSDYEQLRIQKGGFGFKAILTTGFIATVIALGMGWLFFRQKDPNTLLFEQFSKSAGFNLEYNLSQRQFDEAQRILTHFEDNKTYAAIKPEIKLISNLIKAAKAGSDTSRTLAGYSLVTKDTLSSNKPKPVRTLVVTQDGAVPVLTEALHDAAVITTLKKKDKMEQWDQTLQMDKLHIVNNKGKKGIAEDYWYEVETPDNQKGWIFGFFTNASLNRFKPDIPDSLLVPKPISVDTIKK